ncbi:hypothetical protein BOX15_Mlig005180g1 [Macrostomum lignano]|uniref:Ig-like domain-containing protein n=1 Tax=Macrostomum lignano TaxID=282301 RepID=A0A267FN35_9PLAT|nr:hypothetical protein BOX15_Mlig028673g2 [Macrostomum lignano]PAA59309.1 hypothetical protein BOX15_Mlig028673g1 [Macrostomum lignano]PAA75196.1 hypothetical protein BOX15_Mlig005180g1 [Macrostomum lignano]
MLPSSLQVSLLLLLVLTVSSSQALSWEQERLQWLVVTPPNARNVQLNCTSEYIYPFRLLNDSSIIGALGSPVQQVWWILPDGRVANETYNDGNRQVVDRGVGLQVQDVTESVFGLYHCAVRAATYINDTLLNYTVNSVYYYKRGLNLYGADLYGGDLWAKYQRNTLIGSLTAGIFLILVAAYALLDRFGVLAKCFGSNAVEAAPSVVEIGEGSPKAAEAKSAEANAPDADANELSPTASAVETSRASVRSRKSDKVAPAETEAETVA